MTNKYHVDKNICNCHPETCSHWDWAIYDSNNKKVPEYSTYSDKDTAERIVRLLNKDEEEKQNMVPQLCRQRLMKEGKPYPRSSCSVCGTFSPMSKECDTKLS